MIIENGNIVRIYASFHTEMEEIIDYQYKVLGNGTFCLTGFNKMRWGSPYNLPGAEDSITVEQFKEVCGTAGWKINKVEILCNDWREYFLFLKEPFYLQE